MKCLIVDTYYSAFLSSFYRQHPGLDGEAYAVQWRALMDQCFGTADFYSSNLNRLGHEAREIVANCEPLQRQWAKEYGLKVDKWSLAKREGLIPWPKLVRSADWGDKILMAQVQQYRPDVLYIQDMNATSSAFLREVKPYVRLIAGQIAYPIDPGMEFSEYDFILSSFPHFVERFRRNGLKSEYFKLGFEPRLLSQIKNGTRHGVVFVGGLSTTHAERIRFLEHLAKSQPLGIWGYGIETLDQESPLHRSYHGNAWALDMYNVLCNADIALNNHIRVAEANANNMRLYEATGVGTLLITDYKDNLPTLFEPGKEVLAYRSVSECAELIAYYLAHVDERKSVARAGQQRTLREHTYFHRMQELVEIVERRLK
jgi:hypothetical protein